MSLSPKPFFPFLVLPFLPLLQESQGLHAFPRGPERSTPSCPNPSHCTPSQLWGLTEAHRCIHVNVLRTPSEKPKGTHLWGRIVDSGYRPGGRYSGTSANWVLLLTTLYITVYLKHQNAEIFRTGKSGLIIDKSVFPNHTFISLPCQILPPPLPQFSWEALG